MIRSTVAGMFASPAGSAGSEKPNANAKMGTPLFVDSNLHVIAPPDRRSVYPLNVTPGSESEFSEDQVKTPAQLVAEMDCAGIDRGLLYASRFHGFDNSYCADALRGHEHRYVAIANIDILAPDVIDSIDHWIGDRGMHGVRFWGSGPLSGGRFSGDKRGRADYLGRLDLLHVWRRARDLDVPTNAQAITPEVLPDMARLLSEIPDLSVTVNYLMHLLEGGGASSSAAKQLLDMAKYPRTFVNLSADFMRNTLTEALSSELLRALLDAFGAHRLVWSSFGMPLSDAKAIMVKAVAGLSPTDQEGILGEGACDLYPALRLSASAPAIANKP